MDQLLVLALVFLGITVGGYIVRVFARRKRQAAIASIRLEPDTDGLPRILSFYGPSCDACDRQKLVFSDMEQSRPGLFSLELRDATVDYDYARQFGLMVVPTTVVIAGSGEIAAINSGFTSQVKLEEQLDAA
jgi:hypothetical protein